MGIYLGSNQVDMKLGATTQYLSCINIQDLTAYYQKQETYSRPEIIWCLQNMLSDINDNFYTKEQISAMIIGYEIPYSINNIPYKSGSIQLTNRVNNVISPSADISCIMPRTILNGSSLARDFFLQIIEPSSVVNVDFIGYQGENLKFKAEGELKELEASKHYMFYFNELSSGSFYVKQVELNDLALQLTSAVNSTQPTSVDLSTFQLIDCETNYLELSSDSSFIFPAKTYDLSGNWLPRDFMLYLKQPISSTTGSAYDIQFFGSGGETLVFKSINGKTDIGSMNLSSEYLFAITELKDDGISSCFAINQVTLLDVLSGGSL